MRSFKYITLLVALLFSVTMHGQFNPDNPIEPGYYYTLNLEASPSRGGSVSNYSGEVIEAGTQISLNAYPNSEYKFKCWIEEGDTISTLSSFTYTMPERDAYLTAVFEFTPCSPEEPQFVEYANITVLTSPSKGGYSYFYSGEYEVGTTVYVSASSREGYRFKEWTEDGVTLSTSSGFDYLVEKGDHELIAHFAFDPYSPIEPEEPAEACNIYGLNVNGQRGKSVKYPVYLENTDNITGCTFDIKFPKDFVVDDNHAALSQRITDQKLSITDLGDNKYHVSIKGTSPFKGYNGKIIELPVTIPDTVKMGSSYIVSLTGGEVYSKDYTYTEIPCKDGSMFIKDTPLNNTLSLDLPEGWSWISSNFNDPRYLKAKDFLKPIDESIERFIGQSTEIIRDSILGLAGNLKELRPTDSYIVQTNKNIINSWQGNAFFPEDVTIILNKGWNWIGYVPTMERTLTDALQGLNPTEGDVIKDHDNFATFTNGKWTGSLTTMNTGIGYMYHSEKDNSFKYPSNNIPVCAIPRYGKECTYPWNLNRNAYPFNMSVIGEIYADNKLSTNGRFMIGAFIGDECRGIGTYVDEHLFITVYGNEGTKEKVTFKAYDTLTDREYNVSESILFSNKLIGDINKPLILTISEPTDIWSVKNDIRVDLDNNVLYINTSLSITNVSIVNITGGIMIKSTRYTPSGIDVSSLGCGNYIIVINTDKERIIKKILKVN